MIALVWRPSTLPACHGYPCEELLLGDHVVRVWQASLVTAYGLWCWSLDDGRVSQVRGNRGVAKTVARRALETSS